MSAFIIILAYILLVIQFIWYFTCTIHNDIPLILVLLDFILSCIPGFNILMFFINVIILGAMCSEDDIELKNNWINRTFFALNE